MLSRVRRAAAGWAARALTSVRLLVTGIAILVIVVPVSLFYVVVGPGVGNRLGSLAFAVVSGVIGLYSLWEAKAPPGRYDRPRPRSGGDDFSP